jgi:DNA-binding NtrC family response regulator
MREIAENSVLVVDDEPAMRTALQASFQRVGWHVETASGATEAMRKFGSGRHPLVVTDVRMPDGDGLNLMHSVRNANPGTAVILLTAFGNIPEAVQAMRNGACDYLTKPVSFEELQSAVERVMEKAHSIAPQAVASERRVVGNSPALLRALDRARHVARTNADVLIEAESGTGKELLARYVHENSARRHQPFIALNCAAVPEHLLESELFGHVRGAFTGAIGNKAGKFELVKGGTLLLDEIGEMPLNLQPKLLRVLQEREVERLGDTRSVKVDIRVIATTNVSLYSKVEDGSFRADLFYRLNVIPLNLPALRERRGDIPLLAKYFAEQYAGELGAPTPVLKDSLLELLEARQWRGNVRELANFMRRIVSLNDGGQLGAECVEAEMEAARAFRPSSSFPATLPSALRLSATSLEAGVSMRAVERSLLEKTLDVTGGNRTRAAEMMGVSLRTIRNKIREYNLPPRRYS